MACSPLTLASPLVRSVSAWLFGGTGRSLNKSTDSPEWLSLYGSLRMSLAMALRSVNDTLNLAVDEIAGQLGPPCNGG